MSDQYGPEWQRSPESYRSPGSYQSPEWTDDPYEAGRYEHAPNRGPNSSDEDPVYAHAPNHAPHLAEPADQPEPELADVAYAEPEYVDYDPSADEAVTQSLQPPVTRAPFEDEPPRRRYRPDPVAYEPPPPRKYDIGRWLRNLAGVDDSLLRQVWFERARHTALGGIILGTGLIAGLSMWTAINASFGFESLLHLIPALIWMIFIISLDRALVSTMFGAGRRWGAFLMRLALAVMFGFIIAEPLTIRIFSTAIEQHIRDERTEELATLQSKLLACNTKEMANGTAPRPAGCETFLLSFDATPIAAEAELAARQQDEAGLKETVDADNKELARLQEMARRECAGTSGDGLTGDRGYGPECRDRNRDVENFTSTHPMAANANRLAKVREEIATLAAQVSASQTSFESTRDDLVAKRVEEVREHQGPIGLLERMNALHELAATSTALFLGTWAVRLFFVLADCLPVVVKFSGGSSEYDKIVRAQSAGSVRRHAQGLGMLREEEDSYVRRHKADLDEELQQHRAEQSLRRSEAVRRVSSHLRGP